MPTQKKARAASTRKTAKPTSDKSVRNHAATAGQLNRERIVTAAMELVDREGLQALSMRRLGAELGTDPMAVYHYLPNKQALLDAIVEAVMATVDLSLDRPANAPEERILIAARAYRDALLAHVNALPIVLAHGPATPVALRPVEVLVGILRDAGLSPRKALEGMNAIAAAVRGMASMAVPQKKACNASESHFRMLSREQFPHLHEAICAIRGKSLSPESTFESAIRALARGLLGEFPQHSR
jgi:AcrR family transcriptional regulator